MQPQRQFSVPELFSHVVSDAALSVSRRAGEATEQESLRAQAAVHAIMGFQPTDMVEAMLAGQCVMFHELMFDTIRTMFRGELAPNSRATRNSIVAMDRAFGNNLARLERCQRRAPKDRDEVAREDGPRQTSAPAPVEAAPPEATPRPIETVATPVNRAARRHAARKARLAPVPARSTLAAQSGRVSPAPADVPGNWSPSARAIANHRLTPGAMAALDAGDASAFARAMEVEPPIEEFVVAAEEPGRVSGRHGLSSLVTPDVPRVADGDANSAVEARLVAEAA